MEYSKNTSPGWSYLRIAVHEWLCSEKSIGLARGTFSQLLYFMLFLFLTPSVFLKSWFVVSMAEDRNLMLRKNPKITYKLTKTRVHCLWCVGVRETMVDKQFYVQFFRIHSYWDVWRKPRWVFNWSFLYGLKLTLHKKCNIIEQLLYHWIFMFFPVFHFLKTYWNTYIHYISLNSISENL